LLHITSKAKEVKLMHLKIKTIILAVFLIAILILSSDTEGFAMGNRPSYSPGNQGGQQYGNHGGQNGNHRGGRRHHSAPEPSTLILIGTGIVGLWAFRKKIM
jgi:hypothetical protein